MGELLVHFAGVHLSGVNRRRRFYLKQYVLTDLQKRLGGTRKRANTSREADAGMLNWAGLER